MPAIDRLSQVLYPMSNKLKCTIAVCLLSFSLPASATDYTGVLTLLGIPALLVANSLLALLFIFQPSLWRSTAALVLFIPVFLAGMCVLVIDTVKIVSDIDLPDPNDHGFAACAAYIGLLALLVYLLIRLLRPKRRSD